MAAVIDLTLASSSEDASDEPDSTACEALAAAPAPAADAAGEEDADARARLRELVLSVLEGPEGYAADITIRGVRVAVEGMLGRQLSNTEGSVVAAWCKQYVAVQAGLLMQQQQHAEQQQQQQQQIRKQTEQQTQAGMDVVDAQGLPGLIAEVEASAMQVQQEREQGEHDCIMQDVQLVEPPFPPPQQPQQQQAAPRQQPQPQQQSRRNEQHQQHQQAPPLQERQPQQQHAFAAQLLQQQRLGVHRRTAAYHPAAASRQASNDPAAAAAAAVAAAAAAAAAATTAAAAAAAADALPAQSELTRRFAVWPPDAASPDLVPPSCCSAGTVAFMQQFVQDTLPLNGVAALAAARKEAAASAAKAAAPGGKRKPRRPRKELAAAAATAYDASSLVGSEQEQQQRERYGFCWQTDAAAQQLVVLGQVPACRSAAAAAGCAWQVARKRRSAARFRHLDVLYPEAGAPVAATLTSLEAEAPIKAARKQAEQELRVQAPVQQPGSGSEPCKHAATASTAAAGAGPGTAAAAAAPAAAATGTAPAASKACGAAVTVAEKPCLLPDTCARRFYRLELLKSHPNVPVIAWRTKLCSSSKQLPKLIEHVSRLTRVEVVADPCHPCHRNPIERLLHDPQQQPRPPLMVVAASRLPQGQLLGLYFGEVLTSAEDQQRCDADLWGEYGCQHAFNVSVPWAQMVDGSGLQLLVLGDSQRCRMALVNDAKHWCDEMGPCPRSATGACTCSSYAGRKCNVMFDHLVYRAADGSLVPATAVFTAAEVEAGDELLAEYGAYDAGGSYWSVVASNMRQHNHVKRLRLRVQALEARMAEVQRCTAAALAEHTALLTGAAAAPSGSGGGGGGVHQQQQQQHRLGALLEEVARHTADALAA